MKQRIINLKQQIEDNYQDLKLEQGANCQLANSVLEILNLLLSIEIPNEKVEIHLARISNAITIIEEKIKRKKQTN